MGASVLSQEEKSILCWLSLCIVQSAILSFIQSKNLIAIRAVISFETGFLCVILAGTRSVDRTGLELRDSPASASWVLCLTITQLEQYTF